MEILSRLSHLDVLTGRFGVVFGLRKICPQNSELELLFPHFCTVCCRSGKRSPGPLELIAPELANQRLSV